MQITMLSDVSGSYLDQDELLFYLSRIVLKKIDEEVGKKGEALKKSQELLRNQMDEFKTVKTRLISVSTENKRLQNMFKILKTIDALKREGVLVGANKIKISKLLFKIQSQDLNTLISIEQSLSNLLPDDYNRVTIS